MKYFFIAAGLLIFATGLVAKIIATSEVAFLRRHWFFLLLTTGGGLSIAMAAYLW